MAAGVDGARASNTKLDEAAVSADGRRSGEAEPKLTAGAWQRLEPESPALVRTDRGNRPPHRACGAREFRYIDVAMRQRVASRRDKPPLKQDRATVERRWALDKNASVAMRSDSLSL